MRYRLHGRVNSCSKPIVLLSYACSYMLDLSLPSHRSCFSSVPLVPVQERSCYSCRSSPGNPPSYPGSTSQPSLPSLQFQDASAHRESECRRTCNNQQQLFQSQSGAVQYPISLNLTYIFPTPSYTFVSAGKDETSADVNCSIRPSRVLAAFCWRTIRSCCSAKAFFWLISCSICLHQLSLIAGVLNINTPSAGLHFALTS